MKKILCLLCLCFVFIGVNFVDAASKDDLIKYASSSHTINGKDFKLSDADIQVLKRYLAENEVTSDAIDSIISKCDEIISVIDKADVTDLSKLSSSDRNKVLSLAQEAASLAGASLVYDSNTKSISIFDGNGKKLSLINLKNYNGNVLASTGSDYSILVISGLVLVIGVSALFGKKKING